jgi:hypothetical protein
MRKRSLIYEEIAGYLIDQKLIYQSFYPNQINLPSRGATIKSFIYKHSNLSYKNIWTIFFNRLPNSKPIQFTVDIDQLKMYEIRFKLKLLKK